MSAHGLPRLSMEARTRLFDAVWRDHFLPALHDQQNKQHDTDRPIVPVELPARLQTDRIGDDAAD